MANLTSSSSSLPVGTSKPRFLYISSLVLVTRQICRFLLQDSFDPGNWAAFLFIILGLMTTFRAIFLGSSSQDFSLKSVV